MRVNLPASRVFESPKTRANQFASAIHDLRVFLAQEHPKPATARLNFEGAIRLPQFCDFLADDLEGGDVVSPVGAGGLAGPKAGRLDGAAGLTSTNPIPVMPSGLAARAPAARVLLFGSPLYQDEKEPAFSMSGGYFPSDGHLLASREESVYGAGSGAPVAPLSFYWAYFGDPWVNDLHQEKVARFWTLYLEKRGGRLAALSSDLATAVRGFRDGAASPRRWSLDARQTKVEMLRVSREIELAEWITRDALSEKAPSPPAIARGPMKIGIRWRDAIDLDLYASARHGAETLFFQHPRSPEGYYYKDHRSSPGKEYEFIEFESPVDPWEVEVYVNFYKGSCAGGPRGEARIEFDGRIYSAPFSIRAAEGNRGRSGSGQDDCWTRIPVPEVLRMEPFRAAASGAGGPHRE
jgi:hypothetical protein